MQNISVVIPVETIRRAAAVVKDLVAENARIDEAIRALPPVSEEQDGKKGMEARDVVLKICEKHRADACQKAQEELTALYGQYQEAIDEQTTPSGEATQSADYALFRDDLITSPEQLARVLFRNNNVTFAYAAEQYAKRHGWEGYDVRTNETQARDFGAQVFDTCRRGIQFPGGYFSLYAQDDKFLEGVASSCGLDTSFLKSEAEGENSAESAAESVTE